jgi:hypothetical protein
MGKERPSLGEGRNECGIVPYLEGSKGPCEERNPEPGNLQSNFFLLVYGKKLLY